MRQLIKRIRYRLLLRRLAGPRLIKAFAKTYPAASFVEIGANDGLQHDHLRPFIRSRDWTGVMVEPVPYVFQRLKHNYGAVPGVGLENSAIAARDGVLPFFHLRDADEEERGTLPDWYDGIGSLSREAILGHRGQIPDIEARLVRREVTALTFASLCRKHGLDSVDLVVIDCEGYDWEIIRSIDLSAYRPRLLIYEHFHLAPRERAECRAYLESSGFETKEEGFDTFALRTDPDDGLTQRWRGLRPAVAGVSAHEKPS